MLSKRFCNLNFLLNCCHSYILRIYLLKRIPDIFEVVKFWQDKIHPLKVLLKLKKATILGGNGQRSLKLWNKEKNFVALFYGWGSTVSRLQNYYKETVEPFSFNHSVPISFWYSFNRPRKGEPANSSELRHQYTFEICIHDERKCKFLLRFGTLKRLW